MVDTFTQLVPARLFPFFLSQSYLLFIVGFLAFRVDSEDAARGTGATRKERVLREPKLRSLDALPRSPIGRTG